MMNRVITKAISIWSLLRALIRRDALDRELNDEFNFHIEMETERFIREGADPSEARRLAIREFGGLEQYRVLTREARGTKHVEDLMQDLKYALRMLGKNPIFSGVAILTLSLGVGAVTALFSVVDAVVLEPFPFEDPEEVVFLWTENRELGEEHYYVSPNDFKDWREMNLSFDEMAAVWPTPVAITAADGTPHRVRAVWSTENLFDLLVVNPLIGRTFGPEDGPGSVARVILSESLWRNAYGADPSVVGQTITVDGESVEVLGVVPGAQTFPDNTDLWLNMTWPMTIQNRNARWMTTIGRMSDGVRVERAQEDMSRIATRLAESHQGDVGWGVRVNLLSDEIVGRAGAALWVLFGATGLVLLICCGNVANLLLARSEVRRQEMSIRTAYGAGRGRLARQLFTESLLLAGIGALGGLGLAWASMKALHRLAPAALPRVAEVGMDGTVLLVLLASTILTGILFGTVPVVRLYHGKAFGALRDGVRRTQSQGQHRVQSGFVVGQLALAVVVVVGSGLLVKSFAKLSAVDMGFQDTGVLTFEIDLNDVLAPDAESVAQFYGRYLEALRVRPEVVTAGMASNLPLGEALDYNAPFMISDRASEEETRTYHRHVSPGFFETLQTTVLAGRSFLPSDDMGERGVVVINQTLADSYWPDGNALGARLEGLQAQWGPLGWVLVNEAEVVGIVADLAYDEIGAGPEPAVYFSFRQAPMRRMFITLRGVGDPESLVPVARSALAQVNPALPISNPRVLKDIVASAKATDRFSMMLFTLFGVLSLVLASIGVYGVLAFAVEQRMAELGIRMALGASAGTVRGMVLREGSALLLGGLFIGSLTALALGGLASTLLFDVSPRDPLVFGAVLGILTVVGLLASFIPAQRATRVSPASAMRRE